MKDGSRAAPIVPTSTDREWLMELDIAPILQSWPESEAVRVIDGIDGRRKIQRRLPLGLIQLEVEGRPDGETPEGHASYLDLYRDRSRRGELAEGLDSDACQQLAGEALLFYQRRLCFFELGDYGNAARDAGRNLELFAFVREHARNAEDAWMLDQYRGFVLYHRARAEALAALERLDFPAADESIRGGIESIDRFFDEYGLDDAKENSEELRALRTLQREIERNRPRSKRERLQEQLDQAVEHEDYEKAAHLRDLLADLGEGKA